MSKCTNVFYYKFQYDFALDNLFKFTRLFKQCTHVTNPDYDKSDFNNILQISILL